MKLSILMPAFDEAETIAEVVARVQAIPLAKEITLVNGTGVVAASRMAAGGVN